MSKHHHSQINIQECMSNIRKCIHHKCTIFTLHHRTFQ